MNHLIEHIETVSFTGTLFAISDGMTYGWTAPFIPYLISSESHIKTNKEEAEWLETVMLIGAFLGLPITTYLVDKIGRKRSLLLASSVVIPAWIAICFGDRMIYIFVARFFCGMAGNMAFVAAPMYIAEIADQKIRGFLSGIIYVMMMAGCLLVYIIGPYLPFYVPCIIGVAVASLELLTFSFAPESPLFLLNKNDREAAKKSLQHFKPYVDADKELDIMEAILEEQRKRRIKLSDLVTVKSNRKALMIMSVLNSGQHLCAYTAILMNLHLILESAGSIYMESSIAAIIFAALTLTATVFASFQVDKFGRKALLISSSILTGLCLLAMAVYFHLKALQFDVLYVSWIPIVSIMVYALVFKGGVGLVPIVITAEIFPSNLKAIGMTLSDGMFILGGIVGINIYQVLARSFGLYVPFYFFGGYAMALALFTVFCVPETKGKPWRKFKIF